MHSQAIEFLWSFVQVAWHRARDVDWRDETGGTTLETVLWYTAAGLGVVAVAAIIWAAIKDKASEPLPSPTAP